MKPSPTSTSSPVPSPTPPPTPTVCLDEAAEALPVPTRQVPLEVRFISDGNLWVWREDTGEALQISDTGDAQSFSFSPDGQVIAFRRGEPYRQTELWVINRNGTDLRRLVSAEQLHTMFGEPTTTEFDYLDEIQYIHWIDGVQALGFEAQRCYNAIGGTCDPGGAWQVDLKTGRLSPWTPPNEIQHTPYELVSPDGSQIAQVGETGLTLVNIDGSNRREDVLTYPYIPQMEGGGFIGPNINWAPDSQSLVAITFTEDFWEDNSTFTSWRVPVDGAPAQKLHTFTGSPLSVVSPDLHYLAYQYTVPSISNNWELHLATLDGSRDIVYAQGNLLAFWHWAPDGVHFIYGYGELPRLTLGNLCGRSQPLLDPPIAPIWDLTWVDQERFVFKSGGDGIYGSELRLGTVGNGSLLIGPINGDYANYQIKPEEVAPGGSR